MIMVRRSELACRDDWSRSLWQPASAGHDELEPQFSRSPLTGPMPPTSQQDLTTLLAQDIVSSGVSGEDVLLSEARIISEPDEAKNRWETPARPIQMPNFDPRTAIFRAREAYREKVKARATEARLLSSAEPIVEAIREPTAAATETLELAEEFELTQAKTPERSPAQSRSHTFNSRSRGCHDCSQSVRKSRESASKPRILHKTAWRRRSERTRRTNPDGQQLKSRCRGDHLQLPSELTKKSG